MALSLIDKTNYGMAVEKIGTFTPSFTPDTDFDDTVLDVKQVGNVVFVAGMLRTESTWGGSPVDVGTISGVDAPKTDGTCAFPVVTCDDPTNLHIGFMEIYEDGGDIVVKARLEGDSEGASDTMMMVNGFYFTA